MLGWVIFLGSNLQHTVTTVFSYDALQKKSQTSTQKIHMIVDREKGAETSWSSA